MLYTRGAAPGFPPPGFFRGRRSRILFCTRNRWDHTIKHYTRIRHRVRVREAEAACRDARWALEARARRHKRECLGTARFARQARGVLLAGAGERQHTEAAKPATRTPITRMSSQVCAPRRAAPLRAPPSPRAARTAAAQPAPEARIGQRRELGRLWHGRHGEVLSTAAPALAPVAAAVPRGALTRVRRTRAIGSGRAPLASLGERFFLLERTPLR